MNIKDFFTKLRIGFSSSMEKMQSNGKALVAAALSAIVVMIAICIAVFFANVKGPEEVLVPDVVGKELTAALIEMQAKELYPKIQLRYSDVPGNEGTILEQNPVSGAIVKAGRRINLVVSRGVVIDQIEDYTGLKLDDLRIKLQTLFSGSTKPLIVLSDPLYKADMSEAGTILEQDPPAGTKIAEPVTVSLVVSRGPAYEQTRVPNLLKMSVNDVLTQMSRSKITFDFTAHTVQDGEVPGTVTAQQETGEFLPNYSRLTVDFAFPAGPLNGNSYGLFTAVLPAYPYPLSMKLDAVTPDGERYTIAAFSHPGGNLSVPYALPAGTQLLLSVEGREEVKSIVQ